jgi:acyl-coenzyme A synthetase/AMP-(fatty) acid ligase
VPTQGQKALPGKYVSESRISVWFAVPSTAVMMSRLRVVKPGRYPDLRWGRFCGVALPAEVAERGVEAAPNSTLENLYGPTELTIACTLYRWDPSRSPAESEHGLVPIGDPYPGMEVLVVDEELREVACGAAGELLMTGPQLTLGYWRDPERTAAAFVTPPGEDRVFYRTGDRVRRPAPGQPLIYLGRVDNQIKIQGYRVELGEVEALLREVAAVEVAIAIGWPVNASGADGIVAFVGDTAADGPALCRRLVDRLPSYMRPSEVIPIDVWPLNANGKVDRRALAARLQARRPE